MQALRLAQTRRFARSAALASLLGTAIAGGAAVDLAMPSVAEADIDEGYFYANLSSHGGWVNHADFGWSWYPHQRAANWRPYSVGSWVWTTDYGWYWNTYEPWGWATYHYGRWFLDPIYGWMWVPGTTWAPHWVSWRSADAYVGWAPLPPWGGFSFGVSFNFYDDDRWGHYHRHRDRYYSRYHDYEDDYWCFTRTRDFSHDRIDRVALDRTRSRDVLRNSRDLPPPDDSRVRGGRPWAEGIDRSVVERSSNRPVRVARVEESREPVTGKNEVSGDRVRAFKPRVVDKPETELKTPDRLGVAKPRDPKDKREPVAPEATQAVAQKRRHEPARPGGDAREGGVDRERDATVSQERGRGGRAAQPAIRDEQGKQPQGRQPADRQRGSQTIERGEAVKEPAARQREDSQANQREQHQQQRGQSQRMDRQQLEQQQLDRQREQQRKSRQMQNEQQQQQRERAQQQQLQRDRAEESRQREAQQMRQRETSQRQEQQRQQQHQQQMQRQQQRQAPPQREQQIQSAPRQSAPSQQGSPGGNPSRGGGSKGGNQPAQAGGRGQDKH